MQLQDFIEKHNTMLQRESREFLAQNGVLDTNMFEVTIDMIETRTI